MDNFCFLFYFWKIFFQEKEYFYKFFYYVNIFFIDYVNIEFTGDYNCLGGICEKNQYVFLQKKFKIKFVTTIYLYLFRIFLLCAESVKKHFIQRSDFFFLLFFLASDFYLVVKKYQYYNTNLLLLYRIGSTYLSNTSTEINKLFFFSNQIMDESFSDVWTMPLHRRNNFFIQLSWYLSLYTDFDFDALMDMKKFSWSTLKFWDSFFFYHNNNIQFFKTSYRSWKYGEIIKKAASLGNPSLYEGHWYTYTYLPAWDNSNYLSPRLNNFLTIFFYNLYFYNKTLRRAYGGLMIRDSFFLRKSSFFVVGGQSSPFLEDVYDDIFYIWESTTLTIISQSTPTWWYILYYWQDIFFTKKYAHRPIRGLKWGEWRKLLDAPFAWRRLRFERRYLNNKLPRRTKFRHARRTNARSFQWSVIRFFKNFRKRLFTVIITGNRKRNYRWFYKLYNNISGLNNLLFIAMAPAIIGRVFAKNTGYSKRGPIHYTNCIPVFFLKRRLKRYFFKRRYKFKTSHNAKFYYHFLINSLEVITGCKVYLKTFSLKKHLLRAFRLSRLRRTAQKYYRYNFSIGKGFFLFEAVYVLFISLRFKDPELFLAWFARTLKRVFFKRHRKLLSFLRKILLKTFVVEYLKILRIKGFFFDIRGKVGTQGNAKKRHFAINWGMNSFSKKQLRLKFSQGLARTNTGVLGLTFGISY